jgi:hypothetical protein
MDNAQNNNFNLERNKLEDELKNMDSELKAGGDSANSIYKAEQGMEPIEKQLEGMVHGVESAADGNLRGGN